MKSTFWICISMLLITPLWGQQFQMKKEESAKAPLTKAEKSDVIESIADVFSQHYVIEEKGELVKKKILEAFENGAFESSQNMPDLVDLTQREIQHLIQDLHFRLAYFPSDAGYNWVDQNDSEVSKEAAVKAFEEQAKITNFGLTKVEILEGNIGYLNLSSFNAPVEAARPQVAVAFQYFQHTKALIIDVRENGGGQPEYVNLVESYFFDQPTLITSLYNRTENSLTEYRSIKDPGGPKVLDRPVYILTGPATGSGGEALPYDLQAFGKAKVVGEQTMGAANGFTPFMLNFGDQGNVAVMVPDMQLTNLATSTNWEGVGVVPDFPVKSSLALEKAYLEALKNLKANSDQPEVYTGLVKKAEYQLEKASKPSAATKSLSQYVGQYGIRTISVEGETLHLQRENGPKLPLVETGKDQFDLDIQLSPKPGVRFERNPKGEITGFYLIQGENETFNSLTK